MAQTHFLSQNVTLTTLLIKKKIHNFENKPKQDRTTLCNKKQAFKKMSVAKMTSTYFIL
jgi:hypothetical protein